MAEDEAARALPTCPPTYIQRGGTLVCTTCGAVVGANDADQIRHTTWHTTLAELFALAQVDELPAVATVGRAGSAATCVRRTQGVGRD